MKPNPETDEKELSFEKLLEELVDKTDKPESNFDYRRHEDETRSKIACIFTRAFFWIIALALILIPLYNWIIPSGTEALNLKDTLLVLSSIMGGPFGFVVGYYFKGSEKK